VDEFRDDNVFCVSWGKEAAAIHRNLVSAKMIIESPLLPSPLSSLKIGVIPKFSTKKINYLTETLSMEK
jgi:uracil DNA glycosylase